MANAEHLEILKSGLEGWNKWRKKNTNIKPDLSRANLSYEDLFGAKLFNADLTQADLRGTHLSSAQMFGAKLIGANLVRADLSRADMALANLSSARLSSAELVHTDLSGADLVSAIMNHATLMYASMLHTDLTGANLNHANMSYSRLCDAILNEANLSGANLSNADLSHANLSGANLSNADLSHADLSFADLSGADLDNANLFHARLSGTKMFGTTMFGTKMSATVIGLTNLSTCKHLETIVVGHLCTIDFQTLRASKNIPKSFLLKIGLPELYIDYLPDFFHDDGIRLYPVFLSHSWENKAFAWKLYEALIAKGVNVFFDEKKMKPGDNIFDSLSRGIELYDKTILVCSKDSLNSWWVDHELELVTEKERNLQKEIGKKVGLLIPITIDEHIHIWPGGKRMAIKNRVIGDFSKWQDEAEFEKALSDLIHALNVDRPDIKPPTYIKKK